LVRPRRVASATAPSIWAIVLLTVIDKDPDAVTRALVAAVAAE
jgi:hypothetical protein